MFGRSATTGQTSPKEGSRRVSSGALWDNATGPPWQAEEQSPQLSEGAFGELTDTLMQSSKNHLG